MRCCSQKKIIKLWLEPKDLPLLTAEISILLRCIRRQPRERGSHHLIRPRVGQLLLLSDWSERIFFVYRTCGHFPPPQTVQLSNYLFAQAKIDFPLRGWLFVAIFLDPLSLWWQNIWSALFHGFGFEMQMRLLLDISNGSSFSKDLHGSNVHFIWTESSFNLPYLSVGF